MQVHIFDEQSALTISKKHVEQVVLHVLLLEGINTDEVMVHFVDKKRISDLHDQFFDDPTPTDCISFPIDQHTLGEVFICTDVAIEYATAHKNNPEDEATLYLVHSLLHLMGYDDIDEKDRRIMRKKEKNCMQGLIEKGYAIHPDHNLVDVTE